MPLFERIRNHDELSQIVCDRCGDRGLSAVFHDSLLVDELADKEQVLVLKVDDYYHPKVFNANKELTPKSADNLVFVKCCAPDVYDFYMIEFKNTDSLTSQSLKYKKAIEPKFKTVIEDFFNRFAEVFKDVRIGQVKAFLSLQDYGTANEQEFRKFISPLLRVYDSQFPLTFIDGQLVAVQIVSPHITHIHPC